MHGDLWLWLPVGTCKQRTPIKYRDDPTGFEGKLSRRPDPGGLSRNRALIGDQAIIRDEFRGDFVAIDTNTLQQRRFAPFTP